jgi:hypothetical protein
LTSQMLCIRKRNGLLRASTMATQSLLKAEEARQAGGMVQVGESDDTPKIGLAPGKKKETLEANLGNGVKFPVKLTLVPHQPGMELDAKPELLNFKFTQFSDESGPGSCSPMAHMPNMHR